MMSGPLLLTGKEFTVFCRGIAEGESMSQGPRRLALAPPRHGPCDAA
jgi:hypothetical protein